MRAVKADLSRELSYIELHTFSDWHIGDKFSDMSMVKAEIEAVKNNPNAFAVCNGDLMNNATKASVSDSYSELLTPQEKIDKLVELLDPVQDKILMLCQGNHERRTFRESGIDLTSIVASRLNLLDKYARDGGILFLRFGQISAGRKETNFPSNIRKQCYTGLIWHGAGGGKKEGAKAIRLADMACIADTDFYIHSHTHLPMIMKESYCRVNMPNSSVAFVDKLFVNSSAALDYGGYGQVGEFKPATKANPVIILSGSKRDMIARL